MITFACCTTCPEDECGNRLCVDSGECCPHGGCEYHCDECPGDECQHDWTMRPESDTSVCEMCGAER